MARSFHEIVLEGPFMLVKGFLVGFLAGVKPDGRYFFHRKSGIHRETLKGFLKELFELENYVHLCLEAELLPKFEEACKLYNKITGLEIKSKKEVKSANFSFAYEFFNEALAKKAKDIFQSLPEGIQIVDYHPLEETRPNAKGIESYAPLHDFTARGKGTVVGEFEGVIELYLDIKKSSFSESVVLSEVRLEF